jgi:hypothetical protein
VAPKPQFVASRCRRRPLAAHNRPLFAGDPAATSTEESALSTSLFQPPWRPALATIAGALLPTLACADGFADLRAALARQQAATPVKGSVKAETWGRQGEGKDGDEQRGQASLAFEEGPQGLRLVLARETLLRVDQEQRARDKDPKSTTPTQAGIAALGVSEVRSLLSPAAALLARLDDCTPKGETVEPWNGRPARRLSCEMGTNRIKPADRKYIKKFDGQLDVWIAEDGTPLASRVRVAISGRAFVVVSFDSTSDIDQSFQLIGDRLVAVREERRDSSSGAGERGESRVVRTIQLQS